jgi:Domain of unknown function (DUF4258)
MEFDKTHKLSDRKAEDLADRILENGRVIFTNHAEFKRMPERGFDKSDVYRILQKGKVIKTKPGKNNTWKYSFQGEDYEGDEGTVIISFVTSLDGLIITVF